ncbi:MAG: threonine--tRNA ligase [Candidatus Aenigmarchaeota archaeon]|nr:threonine--tRNA ligase [Candidatus Aenigmarchaeota archaeon]
MKILQLHADSVEYEPVKKEIKQAEEVEQKKYAFNDVLVLLTAVEKGDTKETAAWAVDEAKKFMERMKITTLLLYPYAHLSSNLASPFDAMDIILEMERHAKELSLEANHAPFGWNKRFAISVKGHPMAEMSRSYTGKPAVAEAKTQAKPVIQQEQPIEKLPDNDHRVLGQKLDLFSFQPDAPGMVFFHPKGMILRNELIRFSREKQAAADYVEIMTPLLMKKSLWEQSGHWDHYKNNMFFTETEDAEYALKPMNCPGAILFFKNTKRSYRDLPLRISEFGTIHRNELSGVIGGLLRVRGFTQDDAHLVVRADQLVEELTKVIGLVEEFYNQFGFDFRVELSTKPENSIGSDELWSKAEQALEDVLKNRKLNYKVNPGDGAFYGPKIDFHVKDSLGRTWQCGTVQVDFFMPQRFSMSYTDESGREATPIIVHRAIYGSLERFFGILTEHYNGSFPLWLAPVQARVLPITDKNNGYAKKVVGMLKEAGVRAEGDYENHTLEYKIRNASMQKVFYTIVIGNKEEESTTLAVRSRDGKTEHGLKAEDFVKELQFAILRRS